MALANCATVKVSKVGHVQLSSKTMRFVFIPATHAFRLGGQPAAHIAAHKSVGPISRGSIVNASAKFFFLASSRSLRMKATRRNPAAKANR